MKITWMWVQEHSTGQGGWTRAQLACLGVPWPPPKGWRRALTGTHIPDNVAHEFERLGREHRESRARRLLDFEEEA